MLVVLLGRFEGKVWKWDCPFVLCEVISSQPIYKILGQYRTGEPTLAQIDNEHYGETYRVINEDVISERN